MPEDYIPRRAHIEKKIRITPEEIQGILKFLKPTEQEIVRLHYALEGRAFHYLKEICQKYPSVTMEELTLLLERVERMIRIQKKKNKNVPPGLVNVNRPKRKKVKDETEETHLESHDESQENEKEGL